MVKSVGGAPVRGNDFYGTDRFVELVWRELDKGSVLLAAPRRFGKTSVMYRLMDNPRPDYKIVHMDLEHLAHPVDLILELMIRLNNDSALTVTLEKVVSVAKDIWTRLRNTVDEVEAFDLKIKLREQVEPNWEAIGREFLSTLANRRIVFC